MKLKYIWQLFQKNRFNLISYDNPEHPNTIILNGRNKPIKEKNTYKNHEVLKISINKIYKCIEIHIINEMKI
jgi:hypothetical protein